MNLIDQAEQDLSFTLEDKENGFGQVFTVENSVGVWVEITCKSSDISYFVDLQTEAPVDSRQVNISVRMSTLESLNIPTVTEETIFKFGEYPHKVQRIYPDKTRGVLDLDLEAFKYGS